MPTLRAVSNVPDISLDHAIVMVGRHPQCDARLDSLNVSRRHCILIRCGNSVWVRDLGSTNGTWINGESVEIGRLEPGDEVSIAHIRYYVEQSRTLRAAAADQLGRSHDPATISSPSRTVFDIGPKSKPAAVRLGIRGLLAGYRRIRLA
jgi:predicted component of type VI protein secretion system